MGNTRTICKMANNGSGSTMAMMTSHPAGSTDSSLRVLKS